MQFQTREGSSNSGFSYNGHYVVRCRLSSLLIHTMKFQIGVDAAFATCPIRQQKGAIGKQFDDCGGGEKKRLC